VVYEKADRQVSCSIFLCKVGVKSIILRYLIEIDRSEWGENEGKTGKPFYLSIKKIIYL
jgi:hypothetical protein